MRQVNHIFSIGMLVIIAKFIMNFVKKAYKAGRLTELIISSSLLGAFYYFVFPLVRSAPLLGFGIPIAIYAAYWWYLFQHEKVTSLEANPNWVDRDWWWELDGWEFEEEAAKVFRLNGYEAKVTKKTSDGGVDIVMYKNGKKTIAQCKHYSDPVAVSVARELNGLREDFRANELILIASSGVTKSCAEFVQNKPYFHILNLEDIIRMGLRPHSS